MSRAAALVAALLLVAGCDVGSDDDETATTTADERTALAVAGRVPIGGEPRGVAYGEGAVWAANATENTLVRIDPKKRRVVARIRLGEGSGAEAPIGVAVGEGAVWATDPLNGAVLRIDPETNRVAARIKVDYPADIAVGYGAAWVVENDRIVRIDARTNRIVASIRVTQPVTVAVGEGGVWSFDRPISPVSPNPPPTRPGGLIRIDPKTNRIVARITAAGGIETHVKTDLAAGHGAVWITDGTRHTVTRVDPQKRKVLGQLDLPLRDRLNAGAIAVGPRSVWFVNALAVVRVDPQTNAATGVARISRANRVDPSDVAFRPIGEVAVARDTVWVADPVTDTVAAIDVHPNS